MMSLFTVEFYQKENGSMPVADFISSLDAKIKAKTLRTIELLKNNGNELREPYSKNLEDGIYELRTKVGSDISRVLYFLFIGHRIILTNGFIKKTQKTPSTQIEMAKRYRKDFLSRE